MAGPISLKALVHAITSAVASAQAEIERSQIVSLGSFFNEDLTPKLMRMKLPSLKRGDDGKLVIHGVPLITLTTPSQLRIKEAVFRFEVELGDLSDREQTSHTAFDDFVGGFRVIDIDPAPRLFGGRRRPPRIARVVVKVEATEQTEGLARVIGHLNKLHGEHDADSSTDSPEGPVSQS